MRAAGLIVAVLSAACASAPARPVITPVAPTLVIAYAINVPSGVVETQLTGQYPNGVLLSPVEAQQQFDFTSVYHTPNVYYGVEAPPAGSYLNASIVVAPLSAASARTFTHADWPAICPVGTACSWRGHFETALP